MVTNNSSQLGEPNIERSLVDPAQEVKDLMDATARVSLDEGTRPPIMVREGRDF